MADIDRTRANLARTIDAISDRVNPKKNVHRAMDEDPPASHPGRPDCWLAAAAAVVVVGLTAFILLAAAASTEPQAASTSPASS